MPMLMLMLVMPTLMPMLMQMQLRTPMLMRVRIRVRMLTLMLMLMPVLLPTLMPILCYAMIHCILLTIRYGAISRAITSTHSLHDNTYLIVSWTSVDIYIYIHIYIYIYIYRAWAGWVPGPPSPPSLGPRTQACGAMAVRGSKSRLRPARVTYAHAVQRVNLTKPVKISLDQEV